MSREEEKQEHHGSYNCAQSVLLSLREHFPHVYDKILTQAASGFGGGVCCGEICGAVAGAVMAIGLSVDFDENDQESLIGERKKVRELTGPYTEDFKNKFGSLRCCELRAAKCDCGELIEYAERSAEKVIKNLN